MGTRYICFLILFNLYSPNIQGKISIIIPCKYNHVQHLYSLLELYEQQTELPDEIVISISEVSKTSTGLIHDLQKREWRFPVKLLMYNQKLYAGQNRNNACKNATGDIFLCQDADDVPHPQRVEIVKYFFRKYKLDLFLHLFEVTKDFESFKYYDPSRIAFIFPASINDVWSKNLRKIGKCHNGNIGIARHVFEKIQWSSMPKGQDVRYNSNVFNGFSRCLIVKVPLVVYRAEFSSWKRYFNQEGSYYETFYEKFLW